MILQQIAIEKSEYSHMYFRGGEVRENALFVKGGERASLDTYFNSFPYTKYSEYTRVKNVVFKCNVSGRAEISLCTYNGKEEREYTRTGSEGGEISVSVSLSGLDGNGILYPVITATEDTVITNAGYFSEEEGEEINCAIAICTYRRESCVYNNIEILKKAQIKGINKIFVIDNGQSLNDEKIADEKISLLPNKNYGGSGGFTRGITEAYKGGYSHLILMDDDVVIYTHALEKIISFLSLLKSEYKKAHISAAMLPLSNQYMQFEMGARWNGSHIESFGQNINVGTKEGLIENLKNNPIEYGAWWCFCLPLSDVEEYGLPLPLFIKFDDVEYGTRCCKNVPIVTMNGVAVAHEDFDRKYSMHLEYYTVRNQLIMLACHNMQSTLGCILRLMKVSAKHLFLYRYSEMDVILRAFEDYLKGAELLLKGDEELLNKEIMSIAPKGVELETIPEWNEEMRNSYTHKKRSIISKLMQVITFGGHLVPSFMLKKEVSAFPLPDAKVGSAYLRKSTIQYQLGSSTGYRFDRSAKSFFKYFFKCIKMSIKILVKYPKAKKSYKEGFKALTSLEFWEKRLKQSD